MSWGPKADWHLGTPKIDWILEYEDGFESGIKVFLKSWVNGLYFLSDHVRTFFLMMVWY